MHGPSKRGLSLKLERVLQRLRQATLELRLPGMKTARQLDREIASHQERVLLGKRVQKLLDKWQPRLGVHVDDFRIKKMRAFGALNLATRRLWISQALASMSPRDLEYVVVHELMHLLICDDEGSGHDARFYALMDQHLPGWRRRHEGLRSGDGIVASKLPGLSLSRRST